MLPRSSSGSKPQDTIDRWARLAPGLNVLRHYQRRWLRDDLLAGLVLVTILVPVGIAYSVAAGLPPVYGLYATVVPLLVYAVFGPSRIMVLGPDSALAAVIFAVVAPLSAGNPAHAVALAGVMAVVAGLVSIAAGVFKLGFVTELLSKPIRYGYLNGIALVVTVSQLPALFGFSVNAESTPAKVQAWAQGLLNGQFNGIALLMGCVSLALILLLRRYRRVSGILLAVVGATLCTAWLALDDLGVMVLGRLPQGFPAPVWPLISWHEVPAVVAGGVAAAFLAFSETSVLSRAYAQRTGFHVDPDRELIGLGLANLATGFFQGFPISSSASRTPVAETAGAQTQLAGFIGALLVLLLLVAVPNLLWHLPQSVLAAVVIAAMISLVQVRDLQRIYCMRKAEFWLSAGCSVGVVLLGTLQGIGLAVVVSLAAFVWESWRPYSAVLVRVDGLKGYHDVTRYPGGRRIPGLVLFRWDAPLFFANAERFQTQVLAALQASPHPARWLVIAAEPVTSIDVTAADMLAQLDQTLASQGLVLAFAEMKDPVKDQMKQLGLFAQVGEEHFFPTLGQAVNGYLEETGTEWHDWEDTAAAR